MQSANLAVVGAQHRVWEVRRATGEVFRCDLESTPGGWMAWFSVNGQRLGGHRFDEKSPAIVWADSLLTAFQRQDVS